MSGTYVLFDFDGVIADSFSMASALARRVCVENTPDKYRSAFEGNIYDSVATDRGRREAESHGGDCHYELDWWTEYGKSFNDVVAFDGIVRAVRMLASRHTLFVVSSGHRDFILPFLEKNGIGNAFKEVLDVEVHTHKTKKIEMILNAHGMTAAECVFITDTLGDIREASHHHIGSIACTWGWHPRETLEKGVPFRIVDRPFDLPDAVDDYFAPRHS